MWWHILNVILAAGAIGFLLYSQRPQPQSAYRECIVCREVIAGASETVRCEGGHWHHRRCWENLREDGQVRCSFCGERVML